MKKHYNLLLIVVFVFLEIFFLVNPKVIISSFNTNTNICLYSLLPSMFISCLFSQILISLNIENYLPKLLKKSIHENKSHEVRSFKIVEILCCFNFVFQFVIYLNFTLFQFYYTFWLKKGI